MFEKDPQQLREQMKVRYGLFGAFLLSGVIAGIIVGGWPGVVVGVCLALVGDSISDNIHKRQIIQNASDRIRELSAPQVEHVPSRSINIAPGGHFQQQEEARREQATTTMDIAR